MYYSRGKIIKVLILLIAIICLTPVTSLAGPEVLSPRQFILGVDSCVWEYDLPNSVHHLEPDATDSASCEKWVREQGYVFTGDWGVAKDDAWKAATKEPDTACKCGDTTQKWSFTTSPGWFKCYGIMYTCTKPGSNCKWRQTANLTAEVHASAECRKHAISVNGVYYGLNGKGAASGKPECGCVCGESRTQWYPETDATTGQFTCKGVKYECLAPLGMKPPSKFVPPVKP